MNLTGVTAEVYGALVHAGGEARLYQLTEAVGSSSSYVSRCLTQLVARGMVDRVGEGRYRVSDHLGDRKTLSTELSIPHAKTVTPVAGVGRKELSPQATNRDPAAIMLEVIARSPKPSKYAGVVRALAEVLD